MLEGLADCCATDGSTATLGTSDPRLVGLDQALTDSPSIRSTADPDAAADVNDHLDAIADHLRIARTLLDTTAPVGAPREPAAPPNHRHRHRDAAPPVGRALAEQQGPLAGAALAIRANLSLRSTAFRHALRLAAVATLATVLYRIIDPVDGYWIVVAVIFVLKPEFGVTVGRSFLRVTGTLAGVAATTFFLASIQPGPVVLAVLTIVVSAFAFTLFNVNYGVFALFLTCLTVFLAAFLGLPPMTAVLNRATDNLIGSGLTVVAFLVWPTWVATEVPRLVSLCLLAEGRLGQRVLVAFTDATQGSDEDFDQLISAARLSRSNAEAAVERMVHEPHGADKGTLALTAAEGVLAQMHRFGMASLALLQHVRGADQGGQDGLGALAPLQHQFENAFDSLAHSVESDADSPPSGLAPVLQQVHSRLDHGQLQTIIENETDLMVSVVDTTIEIYNGSRAQAEPPS